MLYPIASDSRDSSPRVAAMGDTSEEVCCAAAAFLPQQRDLPLFLVYVLQSISVTRQGQEMEAAAPSAAWTSSEAAALSSCRKVQIGRAHV